MPHFAKTEKYEQLSDNLCFAGTIYDSFEAMEEVMGKLKLERPLFMIYLAKKAFAEEVINLEKKQNCCADNNKFSTYKIEINNAAVNRKFN